LVITFVVNINIRLAEVADTEEVAGNVALLLGEVTYLCEALAYFTGAGGQVLFALDFSGGTQVQYFLAHQALLDDTGVAAQGAGPVLSAIILMLSRYLYLLLWSFLLSLL
jgi:hypothetical protein